MYRCVDVTLVFMFHPIWYLVAQESKLGRKIRILGSFYVERTYPAPIQDKFRVWFCLAGQI
jgi:hypothetical protein